jgi:hypothetical protein
MVVQQHERSHAVLQALDSIDINTSVCNGTQTEEKTDVVINSATLLQQVKDDILDHLTRTHTRTHAHSQVQRPDSYISQYRQALPNVVPDSGASVSASVVVESLVRNLTVTAPTAPAPPAVASPETEKIYFSRRAAAFGSAIVGSVSRMKVELCNSLQEDVTVQLSELPLPFVLIHSEVVLKARAYVRLPVRFVPTVANSGSGSGGGSCNSEQLFTCELTATAADGTCATIALEGSSFVAPP